MKLLPLIAAMLLTCCADNRIHPPTEGTVYVVLKDKETVFMDGAVGWSTMRYPFEFADTNMSIEETIFFDKNGNIVSSIDSDRIKGIFRGEYSR